MMEDKKHKFAPEVMKNIALRVYELNMLNEGWNVYFDDKYISVQKFFDHIITIDIAGPIRFSCSSIVSAIEAHQIFKMLEEFTIGVDTIREFKGEL